MKTREERIEAYVRANRKSIILAFLLAVLLGPIGLMYATIGGGILLILVGLFLALAHPVLALAVWAIAVLAAPLAVMGHNGKLRIKAELIAG